MCSFPFFYRKTSFLSKNIHGFRDLFVFQSERETGRGHLWSSKNSMNLLNMKLQFLFEKTFFIPTLIFSEIWSENTNNCKNYKIWKMQSNEPKIVQMSSYKTNKQCGFRIENFNWLHIGKYASSWKTCCHTKFHFERKIRNILGVMNFEWFLDNLHLF